MSDAREVHNAHNVPSDDDLIDRVLDRAPEAVEQNGDILLLVPSGFKIVPDQDDPDIELLKMKVAELEAILDDRRTRTNAVEATLHALNHDDRPFETVFDIVYGKLRGGS